MGKINSNLTELIEKHFSNCVEFDETYFFENGTLKEGTTNLLSLKGNKKVCLCFLEMLPMTFIVNIEKYSQISLFTCFAQDSTSELHINCAENSLCEQIVMQVNSASQKINVIQKENSTYNSQIFQLAGQRDTIDLHVFKEGEYANTELSGVFFPKGIESYSIHTKVNHNSPLCETQELFRGIADENGSGLFSGLIYVAKDAQKTNARQQNRNMLLSPTSHIHSEPQLEIYADDVICNHGSSTGQIDEESLWYMQARGIDKITATKLLVSGFANDVLERISNQKLRDFITNFINAKLSE